MSRAESGVRSLRGERKEAEVDLETGSSQAPIVSRTKKEFRFSTATDEMERDFF